MNRFLFLLGALSVSAVSVHAQAQLFASTSFSNNTVKRDEWLAASGIAAPTFFENFENIAVGTNISGNSSILPGGLTMTAATPFALTVTNSTGLLGGSNPIDLRAVAIREDNQITFSFTNAVDYVGGYVIDPGSYDGVLTFANGSTQAFSFNTDGAGTGNTAKFWGFYRNDRPAIASFTFFVRGGDNEAGLDNIQFGNVQAVPEPATVAVMGLSLAALGRRRLRRR
jgi:hypothetical protein